ncbi:MAG TPA: hypothetical protein VK771_07000 [Acidimicrobiia bacterium]|jgi:hypothetical protein|nr:hypothetical protein [Acidimicrobiia bacterium]
MSGIEPSEYGFGATEGSGADSRDDEDGGQDDAAGPWSEADGRVAAQLHDRVIDRMRGAELALAAIVGLGAIDARVAAQLRDVMDQLDGIAKDLRSTDLAVWVRDRDPRPDENGHLTIVKPAPDRQAARPMSEERRRYLCSFQDGQVFAYATPNGHDFFRASDHTPWAHESDGLLLSARSGTPLAVRAGSVFHDLASNEALYFERTE